jgi:hypothetical protein
MIDALGLEVAAIRNRGGGTRIELRGGERIGENDGFWLYRFIVTENLTLRDETPVRVRCGAQDVSGVLISFHNGILIVALEKDLGERIATARLVTNDSLLVERLKERLEKIRIGAISFNRQAGERALGLSIVRTADAEPNPIVLQGDNLPNKDQVLAIRRSLGSDMTYVWGPPGTGKTMTLARIVEAHYRAKRSVLLVSNTNIALDTALERVADRLKGEPDFYQGLVIRQGPVVKEELRQRYGPQVIFSEIKARLGAALRRKKVRLEEDLTSVETTGHSLNAAVKNLERLAQMRRSLIDREEILTATRSTATSRAQEAKRYHARAASMRSNLDRVRKMGSVRRFFSGQDAEQIEREIAANDRAIQTTELAARAVLGDIDKHEANIRVLRIEIDDFASTLLAYPSTPELQLRLSTLRASYTQIRERIAAIDLEIVVLEQELLARCRILATTVYRTYLSNSRQFDVVVIDEASMLMPPLVYYAAGLATQSVTVAGDFRQLPPIVTSDDPQAEDWLKRDIFEKAGIPEQLRRKQPTPHLVTLGIQYRMCVPICNVINNLFYSDHPLLSDPCVARGCSEFPLGVSSLLYVDSSPFHPWSALPVGSNSRYNLFHALQVRNIVLHLAESGFLPQAGVPNDAVGVVTPYASQARLIQALLEDRLGARAAGIAATVHRFQGNEKKVIVLDLTDSVGAPLGRFLQATRIEEDGARLLNVAASRARHHIVLVGNFQYLRAQAPGNAIVRRLIENFEEHGAALDLKILLPLAERDWVDGLHRVSPTSFVFQKGMADTFTESTFYPAFQLDLAKSRESIVIFSPFATDRGSSRWIDLLRAALTRGVHVRLITRPPTTNNNVDEIVRALRSLGVAVDLRTRMHQKIAILDGRILWHGSLNILSHRDTDESMLRIESPAACSQLARFVTPPVHRNNTPRR